MELQLKRKTLHCARENHVHVKTVKRVFLWAEPQIASIVEPQR